MSNVFIIAEIGINHNGDLGIAKKLIDLASDSGCDAVKFQKRDINLVYDKKEMDTPRSSGVTRRKDPEQELGDPQGGSPRSDGSKEKLLAMTPVLPKALQSKYKLDD